MPNRILRDYTTSKKFDLVTADAERLFTRLIMKADDYGRFHADPKLVKSFCFPRLDDLRTNTVAAWLDELSDRQLVFRYGVKDLEYLAIINFRQRLKNSVPKFPPPPGKPDTWLPDDGDSEHFREVPGSSGKSPPYTESETGVDKKLTTKGPDQAQNAGSEGRAPRVPGLDSRLKTQDSRLKMDHRLIAQTCEELLGEQWVNDAGKWINRIRGRAAGNCDGEPLPEIKADPEKVRRVFAELKSALVEGRVKTTPAQYAEQIWKEFA